MGQYSSQSSQGKHALDSVPEPGEWRARDRNKLDIVIRQGDNFAERMTHPGATAKQRQDILDRAMALQKQQIRSARSSKRSRCLAPMPKSDRYRKAKGLAPAPETRWKPVSQRPFLQAWLDPDPPRARSEGRESWADQSPSPPRRRSPPPRQQRASGSASGSAGPRVELIPASDHGRPRADLNPNIKSASGHRQLQPHKTSVMSWKRRSRPQDVLAMTARYKDDADARERLGDLDPLHDHYNESQGWHCKAEDDVFMERAAEGQLRRRVFVRQAPIDDIEYKS